MAEVPEVSEFRFAPAVAARLVGALIVVLAVLLVLLTVVVAVADLSVVALAVVAGGVLVVLAAGLWVARRVPVVRLGSDGYRVRLVRGAGVQAAAWSDVEEVATASPGGLPVVRLRLTGGGSTTIPVTLLDVDREQFVRDLRDHLQRGQGMRPLS